MAARKSTKQTIDLASFDTPGKHVVVSTLAEEMEASYGEYCYSVIHSRALPDARDGLKPVHRRIMYGMQEMGLRPDRGYVKSARVVGEVMGKYHPHGDSAIYDAMVRLSQDFSLNTPLIDGHGAWGTPDDGPAASRYTECKMTEMASLLADGLDEETVDMELNYDGSLLQPSVLPAAFPNLLVNGTSGIAVGMASNMIPHNLGEVIAATRWLITHPDATLDKLMEFIPGPDLPTGGILLGLDQARLAYETGRGVVRMRARVEIGPLEGSRGRQAITVTQFPYGVGPETVITKMKEATDSGQLQGVADVKILTDMTTEGERMVVECKSGVNPQALLADLYRLTPLEMSFGINNNVLVDDGTGVVKPETLGLKRLLEVFLGHRYEVVTRRTVYRLRKATERRHIVEGTLVALDNIDKVVKIIRSSKDTAEAKSRLVSELKGVKVVLGGKTVSRDLDDVQAAYILEMPLRRLVNLEVDALRVEWDTLTSTMASLQAILDDKALLRKVVSDELAQVAKDHAEARRTTLMDGDLKEILAAAAVVSVPLEVKDDPCQVVLSTTGLLARTPAASEEAPEAGRSRFARSKHDTVAAVVDTTARGKVLLLTSRGRALRVDVLGLQVLPPAAAGNLTLSGMPQAADFATGLAQGEKVIGLSPVAPGVGIALGTASGQVMVCKPDWPVREDDWTLIKLADGDELVGAGPVRDGAETLVFVTADASLLRYDAGKVRPQGRGSGGMAGIALASGGRVVAFNAVRTDDDEHGEPLVVTSTGGSVKVTPLVEYPAKGRATGGVRCHRFLKTENTVQAAWVGPRPVAATKNGDPVELPDVDRRRDGSGTPAFGPDLIGHLVSRA